jgi:diguanylate cyclase (GGDEF)-like protein
LNNKPSLPKNILILNPDGVEATLLKSLCKDIGPVYCAADLEQAISLLTSISVNVLIAASSLAQHDRLRGLFKPYTSVIVTGAFRTELKTTARTWPPDRYVQIALIAEIKSDNASFQRIVQTALSHSLLLKEVNTLRHSLEQNEVELQEAFHQIQDVKDTVEKSIVSELEKRIAIEVKYQGFKREKNKIETILKKLYQANDVTMLLDIVYDIKDLIHAGGITMYVMDESETTGKYLKPLVWDDSILSHTEFTKHIVLLDYQDFAATTALEGREISATDLSDDRRLSSRYLQHLTAPLENILCIPIKRDREVIGVLEVYNKTVNGKLYAGGFTAEDRNILEQIGEHISIAINKLNLIQFDALTGLLRPDPFFDNVLLKLQSQIKRHQEESSFAMVMGDVDWFKHYNDRNGHEAGNDLLRELAEILKSSTREGDILCRYGGEEFLFFLSCSDCDQEAMLFTNRIRKNIENHYFDYQEFQPRKNLTMSFGITTFSRNRFPDLDKLSKYDLISIVNESDIAMAEAKGKRRSGAMPEAIDDEEFPEKNRIIVYQPKVVDDKEFPESIAPSDEIKPEEVKPEEKISEEAIAEAPSPEASAQEAPSEATPEALSETLPESEAPSETIPPEAVEPAVPEATPDQEAEKPPVQIPPPSPLPEAVLRHLRPPEQKDDDRRKNQRHDTTSYLIYKNGTERKVVRTLNMSLGGVKVVSEAKFERGHSFELSLILGETTLECKGDVVYCAPAETSKDFYVSGVKFRDLSFNDWKVLEKYFIDLPDKTKATH